MSIRTFLLLVFVLTCAFVPMATLGQDAAGNLGIAVVQGQNGTIDELHSVNIIVRVTAPGAIVTFKLPPAAGVSFSGGASQISLKSDSRGIAQSGNLAFIGKGGAFDVDVQATLGGQTATVQVHETNVGTGPQPAATKSAHKSHAAVWLAVIGAAAAGAAVAASQKGGSSSSAANPATPSAPPVDVTSGSPTIGPPQ